MKLIKIFTLVISLVILCGCTTAQSKDPNMQGSVTTFPEDSLVVSYKVHRDENSGAILYYPDVLGELAIEDGKISQDDGNGATLTTTVTEAPEGVTGSALMEEKIDRNKTVLAEFGETSLYFFETSDEGINVCQFGVIDKDGKLISFEMQFPTDERTTYFEIVSVLFQIYSQNVAAGE